MARKKKSKDNKQMFTSLSDELDLDDMDEEALMSDDSY